MANLWWNVSGLPGLSCAPGSARHLPLAPDPLIPSLAPPPPRLTPQIGWSSTGQADWDNLVMQANTLVQRIQMTVPRWVGAGACMGAGWVSVGGYAWQALRGLVMGVVL